MVVCKSWHTLISSSEFISSHLSKARASKLFSRCIGDLGQANRYRSLVKLDDESCELQLQVSFKLDRRLDGCFFRVIGSCGGLLCLFFHFGIRTESREVNLHFKKPIIIWNPCIRRHVLLPTPTIMPEKNCTLGFGATGCDYKVVRMVNLVDSPVEVEIYSLGSVTWRRLHVGDLYRGRMYCPGQALVRGRLHWIASDDADHNILSHTSLISSFDMDEEVFKDVLFPDNLSRKNVMHLCLSVVGEELCAIQNDDFTFCCIWVMKEYGLVDSWTKLYSIDFSPAKLMVREVIRVRKNGEVDVFCCMVNKVVTYDPKTRQISDDPEKHGLFYIGNYMESLVFLGGEKHSGAERPLILEFKSLTEGDVPQA